MGRLCHIRTRFHCCGAVEQEGRVLRGRSTVSTPTEIRFRFDQPVTVLSQDERLASSGAVSTVAKVRQLRISPAIHPATKLSLTDRNKIEFKYSRGRNCRPTHKNSPFLLHNPATVEPVAKPTHINLITNIVLNTPTNFTLQFGLQKICYKF